MWVNDLQMCSSPHSSPRHHLSFNCVDYFGREISGQTNADHSDHQDLWRTAYVTFPGQSSQPTITSDHLCCDHHIPRNGNPECHPHSDRGDDTREHDPQEYHSTGCAKRQSQPEVLAFDIANSIKDIDDNNEEGPDKGNEDDAGLIGRPEQDRHRHPGQWWNWP